MMIKRQSFQWSLSKKSGEVMGKREGNIILRVSDEERKRIRAKMEELGIRNMSAYIRKMALDGYCVKLGLEEIREALILLRRCSNNLNQFAKKANETGSIYQADIQDIQERMDEIWEVEKEILVHLASIR